MIRKFALTILLGGLLSCQSQTGEKQDLAVGGPCEGCEAAGEYPYEDLTAVDTIQGFTESHNKLKVSGTVYKNDGQTPAPGVIIYLHQTNEKGIYPNQKGDTGWARRHGYHRGWVKTGADGVYTFYTLRPGSYPNRDLPEHIHLYIKEPGKTAYYIDDIVFEDDPLLTKSERAALRNRGGSGLVTIEQTSELGLVERDIILGKNIENYQ